MERAGWKGVGSGEVVGCAEIEGSEGWEGPRSWMVERHEAFGGVGRSITVS